MLRSVEPRAMSIDSSPEPPRHRRAERCIRYESEEVAYCWNDCFVENFLSSGDRLDAVSNSGWEADTLAGRADALE